MTKERKILAIEYTAIVLFWVIAIITPILFSSDINKNIKAMHVLWAEFSVIGFAFIINRFLLMPSLFFAKKYTNYALCIVGLLLLITLFLYQFNGIDFISSLFGSEPLEPMDMRGAGAAPPRLPQDISSQPMAPHIPPQPQSGPPRNVPPVVTIIPPSLRVIFFTIIVIALDMGLSIAVKWLVWEQKQAEVKRESISAKLSNLQNQVSPHFFMNTLNNIHALVEIDPKRAQKTIIELSGLMDYLLYESSNIEKVALQRELEFIDSYINLMRLRYPKRVTIDFSYSHDIPYIKIPPLLFLNFIENTFKYGVDYSKESFINISFYYNNEIEMVATNSNHSATVKSTRRGIGISNTHKRLKLLYGNRYSLNISNNEDIYSVNLKIPIV